MAVLKNKNQKKSSQKKSLYKSCSSPSTLVAITSLNFNTLPPLFPIDPDRVVKETGTAAFTFAVAVAVVFKDATDDFGFTVREEDFDVFVLEAGVVVESSATDFFDLGVAFGVFGVVVVVVVVVGSTTVFLRARDLGFDFVVVSFSD